MKTTMEQILIARKTDGNFVAMETFQELEQHIKSHSDEFPSQVQVDTGRYAKDPEGRECFEFLAEDGALRYRLYLDSDSYRGTVLS